MTTAVLPSIFASFGQPGHPHALVFTVVGLGLALALGFAQGAVAQQNRVTAIDIALEPDATMIQHARDANARLLKSFPNGFTLDQTHHPHVTMLQQFVRTDDLEKVFAAANAVLAKEKPITWKTCIGCKMHSSKPLSPTSARLNMLSSLLARQ
jgi:hypothetical protein